MTSYIGWKRARSSSPSPLFQKSIQNQTNVALQITKQLLLKERGIMEKNIVFSPLSIHVVLSMIAAGAKGFNQEKMLRFLKSSSIEELNTLASNVVPLVFANGSQLGGPLLSFANGVMETDYKAALKQVDFQNKPEEARREVNSWGEKETKGLITDILPPMSVSSETRLILANALYFKGEWDMEFNASKTRMHEFNLLHNAGTVKAPFMTKSSDQFISVFQGFFQSFKVLMLPYKQGEDYYREFCMYIILPNARNGLPALVKKFCSELDFIDRHMPTKQVPVGTFLIPKFKISFDFEASRILETVGFPLGGLTEMVNLPVPVGVSEIFHKACIEVNEKGTEASAVTAASVMLLAGPRAREPPPVDFVADHPFLYLIREEVTKTVMFVGQVLNPIED